MEQLHLSVCRAVIGPFQCPLPGSFHFLWPRLVHEHLSVCFLVFVFCLDVFSSLYTQTGSGSLSTSC